MIEVLKVQPSAREMRPLTRGWGGLHWWACLPLLLPFVGLWTVALIVIAATPGDDALREPVGIVVVVTSVAWALARVLVHRVTVRAGRAAPGGAMTSDWRIDEAGLHFRTHVSASQVDWAGILAAREERDRFVFLLSPQSNPVLPKRCLAEPQLGALRALIAEATASGRLGAGVDYPPPSSDKA